jgi:hypothetical protein
VLTIENKHAAEPPEFEPDNPELRHYYFENEHGEQLVYVYNTGTRAGGLYHGGHDWKVAGVQYGVAHGFDLDYAERTWLMGCWFATGGV